MGVGRMAEKEAHQQQQKGTGTLARDQASGSGAGNAGRDWGRLAGVGAAVPGMGVVPLDAQEPCLQLCQCDLRDDSIASLHTGP